MLRRDEIVYADRVRNDLRFEENANDFRDLVERITSRLDAATAARMRQLPEYIRLMGSRAPVRVFRIALDGPAAARDTFARDFDFSETSISTLFERGRSAALEVLASDATEPPGDAPGRSGGARPPTP